MERETPPRRDAAGDAADGDASPGGTNWQAWQETLRAVGPYLGFGFEVAATIVFFVGGGFLLDRWLGTTPWLAVAGGALSLVGVWALVRRVSGTLAAEDSSSSESPASEQEPPA